MSKRSYTFRGFGVIGVLRFGGPTSHLKRHMAAADDGVTIRKSDGSFLMFIRPGLKNRRKLEIILHELLHAADWAKDEEWVTETAEGMSKVLWNLGYRPTKED